MFYMVRLQQERRFHIDKIAKGDMSSTDNLKSRLLGILGLF